MIAYEVTCEVEPRLAPAYEQYMREKHIPEVFATGCFHCTVFSRSTPGRYRTSFMARTQGDLDRYLQHHTEALRADFAAHFPEGVSLSREVWVTLGRWGGAAP